MEFYDFFKAIIFFFFWENFNKIFILGNLISTFSIPCLMMHFKLGVLACVLTLKVACMNWFLFVV